MNFCKMLYVNGTLTFINYVELVIALQGVVALMNQAIHPLVEAIQRNIESMLLRMHSEDFAR